MPLLSRVLGVCAFLCFWHLPRRSHPLTRRRRPLGPSLPALQKRQRRHRRLSPTGPRPGRTRPDPQSHLRMGEGWGASRAGATGQGGGGCRLRRLQRPHGTPRTGHAAEQLGLAERSLRVPSAAGLRPSQAAAAPLVPPPRRRRRSLAHRQTRPFSPPSWTTLSGASRRAQPSAPELAPDQRKECAPRLEHRQLHAEWPVPRAAVRQRGSTAGGSGGARLGHLKLGDLLLVALFVVPPRLAGDFLRPSHRPTDLVRYGRGRDQRYFCRAKRENAPLLAFFAPCTRALPVRDDRRAYVLQRAFV